MKRGDTVYDIHGREGFFLCGYDCGSVVVPVYDGDNQEPSYGEPERWTEVFLKPPTERLEAKIGELERVVSELTAQRNAIRTELSDAERERKRVIDRLKQVDALRHIEDYLDGKFAYFVVVSDYSKPTIESAEEAIAGGGTGDENRYGRGPQKLLTLFGDTKGDLQWRINRYSDGSGSYGDKDVYPCKTREEAIEIIRKLYAEAVEAWRKSGQKHHGRAISWTGVDPTWIDVPADVQAYVDEVKSKAATAEAVKKREQIAKLQAELAQLEGGAR